MKRIICLIIAAALALSAVPAFAADTADSPPQVVNVIFTADIHDHLIAERYLNDAGQVAERGGFPRLKSLLEGIKEVTAIDPLIIDGGDFSMGTLFQSLYTTDAPELRLMGELGYDAVTLGNHEFDYRSPGLVKMLNAAVASGDKLPLLLISNIDWDETIADPDKRADAQKLKDALEKYGAKDWTIIEKNGVKIALFGIMGKEADSYAPESGLYFKDPVKRSREIVKEIKADGRADMIVCLSHSGLNLGEPDKSEDEILAAKVPDIDLILSAHTHTMLEKPRVVGKTTIVACESYLKYVGFGMMVRQDDGRWKNGMYKLYTLSAETPEEEGMTTEVEAYKQKITKDYLAKFGYEYDEKLAESSFSFKDFNKFGEVRGEEPFGDLLADAYAYAYRQTVTDKEPVITVVPKGVIRGTFIKGDITASDAFNILSLGIGADGVPGYPLVEVYLTGAELKTIAEVDTSVGDIMNEARLYMAGLKFTYNPKRLILNRVTDVTLSDGTAPEKDKLYRVVTGLYSCQMLGMVGKKSFGLLKLTPKDKNGGAMTDFEKHIVRNADGTELKEWVALAQYLEYIKEIPKSYEKNDNRKVLSIKGDPASIFKEPNNVFFLLLLVVIVGLAVFIVPITLLGIRASRKKKRLRREIAERFAKVTEYNSNIPKLPQEQPEIKQDTEEK
ncbi:5'-nucleotidase [Clostridia bacterium]|nr:5'-nucleotidase [Clostridia bacterium]